MRHVTKVFVKNKSYFFYTNQAFTWSYFFHRLRVIFTKKFDKTSITMFAAGTLVYYFLLIFQKFSPFYAFIEAMLLICIIASCIMDIKTMSIDYFLSYSVLALCVIASGILFKEVNFNDFAENIYFFLIIGLGIIFWIITKFFKKNLMGGADFDFFLGMVFFFKGYNIFTFIIIACVFGVSTKLLINKIDKNKVRVKEFPFLPAISLAFYFTRVFIN